MQIGAHEQASADRALAGSFDKYGMKNNAVRGLGEGAAHRVFINGEGAAQC